MTNQLNNLYREINQRGRSAISGGSEEIDGHLHQLQADSRRGLTLLGHLPAHVCRNIEFALQELKQVEPQQYYYPANDMHITVMDILACRPQFELSDGEFNRYRDEVARVAKTVPAIHWRMRGLMVSPGAVMVKEDYGPELEELRQKLRQTLPEVGLRLAERYPTFSGHVTVARFSSQLTARERFLDIIRQDDQLNFGEFTMHSLDLVVHDWYNQRIKQRANLPLAN